MRELKASLNQVIAGRTQEEYKIDNHDKIKKTKAIIDICGEKSRKIERI